MFNQEVDMSYVVTLQINYMTIASDTEDLLIQASKVFVIYQKMKSTARRDSKCIKKVVNGYGICYGRTAWCNFCKSILTNRILIINLHNESVKKKDKKAWPSFECWFLV